MIYGGESRGAVPIWQAAYITEDGTEIAVKYKASFVKDGLCKAEHFSHFKTLCGRFFQPLRNRDETRGVDLWDGC
jgi:coproporphyrinogen III oxidase